MNWEEFDTYMIYNEEEKRTVTWTVYGDNDEYFLSQEYEYHNDCHEEIESTREILINSEIDENNSLVDLIRRTKNMVGSK